MEQHGLDTFHALESMQESGQNSTGLFFCETWDNRIITNTINHTSDKAMQQKFKGQFPQARPAASESWSHIESISDSPRMEAQTAVMKLRDDDSSALTQPHLVSFGGLHASASDRQKYPPGIPKYTAGKPGLSPASREVGQQPGIERGRARGRAASLGKPHGYTHTYTHLRIDCSLRSGSQTRASLNLILTYKQFLFHFL